MISICYEVLRANHAIGGSTSSIDETERVQVMKTIGSISYDGELRVSFFQRKSQSQWLASTAIATNTKSAQTQMT